MRAGKTTILREVGKARNIPVVAGDAIEHGLRNVITGKPHQLYGKIEIHGTAEPKTSITQSGKSTTFTRKGTESDLSLLAISGMLDYYQRNDESVAFEATAISPDWVTELIISGFDVQAAFVGWTNPNHADAILDYARQNPKDWINFWLKSENDDETTIRKWAAKQVENNLKLKADAERLGFVFFDISAQPFSAYVASVKAHLLHDS